MRLRGVGVCVGSRWQTATASPRPPEACRRAGSLRSRPGSRPHAEQSRASPILAADQILAANSRMGEGGVRRKKWQNNGKPENRRKLFFPRNCLSHRSAPPGTRTRNQLIKSFALVGVSA
jgi:hypothetical protein